MDSWDRVQWGLGTLKGPGLEPARPPTRKWRRGKGVRAEEGPDAAGGDDGRAGLLTAFGARVPFP